MELAGNEGHVWNLGERWVSWGTKPSFFFWGNHVPNGRKETNVANFADIFGVLVRDCVNLLGMSMAVPQVGELFHEMPVCPFLIVKPALFWVFSPFFAGQTAFAMVHLVKCWYHLHSIVGCIPIFLISCGMSVDMNTDVNGRTFRQ